MIKTRQHLLNGAGSFCLALALFAVAAPPQASAAETPKIIRASTVVGSKVFDQKGNKIGDIKDVLFDEDGGGCPFGVLDLGGYLGIGDKLSAVPWQHIKQSDQASPGYVLDADKAKLVGGMNFDDGSYPKTDSAWLEKADAYYGMKAPGDKKLVRASKAMNAELYDEKGDKIGTISDLLINPNTGVVGYAIANVGDSVGKKGQMTTIPWKLIRQSPQATTGYVVNVSKAKLESAAFFSSENQPDYNDESWNNKAADYWGQARNWWDDKMN